ncbi:hypothetical protein QBC38DRAFT_496817 [Podospora fimiseda]|uniref:Uncharacterized protein n=1 Tax=Podospora fimiseda TaxID=252190 RepID=A0AAN7BVH0_9PEZI|nr:hypothetical protein QBC38DRAFT_496817 [Podospora fimiseda]
MTTAAPALTTTFTPPESCLLSYTQYTYSESSLKCYANNILRTQIPCIFMHLGPAISSSQCLPPNYEPASSFYYSPGICPSGYELACSSTVGAETRGTCCPSLYNCMTPSTWWPWYSTDLCTYYMPATVTYVGRFCVENFCATITSHFEIAPYFSIIAPSWGSSAIYTTTTSAANLPESSKVLAGSPIPATIVSDSSKLSAGAKALPSAQLSLSQ